MRLCVSFPFFDLMEGLVSHKTHNVVSGHSICFFCTVDHAFLTDLVMLLVFFFLRSTPSSKINVVH